jgi:serine/threonine protein phosphatase 1
MATIAIGDIHGNRGALEDLLDRVEPELGPADTLVFLGDYIDRGPDARGTVERIISLKAEAPFRVVTLLGNHEDWMLQTMGDYTRHSWVIGMEAFDTVSSYSDAAAAELRDEIGRLGVRLFTEKPRLTYEVFFDLLPPAHRAFFETLEPYHRVNDLVFVHGGLDIEGGAVETQKRESLIWGSKEFPDRYRGEDQIVYGHWNNYGVDEEGRPLPRIVNRTFGLDTISTGVLTAIRFPDQKVIQSRRFQVS